MTACQTSSPLANQICYFPMAWSCLSEIYHMASTDMDCCALNSLGTRIIIAVKVYQSQKKQFLLVCFSALMCLVQGRQCRAPPFTGEVAPCAASQRQHICFCRCAGTLDFTRGTGAAARWSLCGFSHSCLVMPGPW